MVNQQKHFARFIIFWPLRWWSCGEEVNRFKNKIWDENFFSANVERNSRKLISADIKTDVKQEIKKLLAVSYNFSQNYLLKI